MSIKKVIRGFLSTHFKKDLSAFKRQMNQAPHLPIPLGKTYPILNDGKKESGIGDKIYFSQDLYVAQEIFKAQPVRHVDIGSRIDGFIAHVASFREIEMFDIRPLSCEIRNVRFTKCNLMSALPPEMIDCTDSLSCLHALEHFGLGRYGDPIDIDGHLKGFENLAKMVKKGGRFYLSVPLGPLRVEFNAHRVFSLEYLLTMIKEQFEVQQFSYISDSGILSIDVTLKEEDVVRNLDCKYGCAIFSLVKR